MAIILITGALGNVGSEVVTACTERGLRARVADRSVARLKERFPLLESVRFDFEDRATWPVALAGCDAVFLLRPPPISDMDATLNPFVDAAYEAGVAHIVFLSVLGADTKQWVPHRKVELHLSSSGTAWTVLRLGFFAQNLQDAYRRDILEDRRLYVPAGQGRVAFLDVRDAAQVASRIFESPAQFCGQALTLTGPEALSFDDVATVLTSALGTPVRYTAATIMGYFWHLVVRRRMSWMQALVQTILHVGLRKGDAERVDATVQAMLGRPPGTLASYVARTVATWRT